MPATEVTWVRPNRSLKSVLCSANKKELFWATFFYLYTVKNWCKLLVTNWVRVYIISIYGLSMLTFRLPTHTCQGLSIWLLTGNRMLTLSSSCNRRTTTTTFGGHGGGIFCEEWPMTPRVSRIIWMASRS